MFSISLLPTELTYPQTRACTYFPFEESSLLITPGICPNAHFALIEMVLGEGVLFLL